MNEYYKLDCRSTENTVPGMPDNFIMVWRKTLPELVTAISRFREDCGDFECYLWHWKNGKLVEGTIRDNDVLTINEFVERYGQSQNG